jgi:hypothetical protein
MREHVHERIQTTQLRKKNNRGKRKEKTTTKEEVVWSTAKNHVETPAVVSPTSYHPRAHKHTF